MLIIEDRTDVAVAGDRQSVWTWCRECEETITEYASTEADLWRLVQDAVDHICGLHDPEVDHG